MKSGERYSSAGRRRTLHSLYLVGPCLLSSRRTSNPLPCPPPRLQAALFSRWVKSFTRDITPHPPVTLEDSTLSSSYPHPPLSGADHPFAAFSGLSVLRSSSPFISPYLSLSVGWTFSFATLARFPQLSFSQARKRRKHNIITISKSRFLMSSRGHNAPSRPVLCLPFTLFPEESGLVVGEPANFPSSLQPPEGGMLGTDGEFTRLATLDFRKFGWFALRPLLSSRRRKVSSTLWSRTLLLDFYCFLTPLASFNLRFIVTHKFDRSPRNYTDLFKLWRCFYFLVKKWGN